MILVVIFHRQCRTINNVMMCNIATATLVYAILQIISAGFALQSEWFTYQPACFLRAYLYNASCTAVCVSYTVQSISRLFFTLFYKHRLLLTWRMHWFLISITYVAMMILPIPAASLQVGFGFGFEVESRFCTISTKVFSSSLLCATTAYLIPISTSIIIYLIILFYIRQSTRRVNVHVTMTHIVSATRSIQPLNLRREIKLLKNILLLVIIIVCAGLPYMSLLFWQAIQPLQTPPTPFYLLVLLVITISLPIQMIVMIHMTTDIRNVILEYLQKVKLM